MIDILLEMLGYPFLVRAVIVGGLVSICAALLGVNLVLKRYSMIGDGLSHVGFGALAAATAMNAAPLTVALPVVMGAAFLLLRLSGNSKIKGDAAIALISTGSLAVGVVIISRTTGMNTDVCNYLFGSILAMSKADVYLSVVLSIVIFILFIVFYHKLFVITFDETFAKACGVRTGLYNMLIAFLTAIIIVLGMRMMGALLISSLIIFPALTSMRVFKKFRSVTICSAFISIFCFFAGVAISYSYETPAGASVVIMNIAAFLLFWLANFLKISISTTFSKKDKNMKITRGIQAALILGILTFTACGRENSENSTGAAADAKILSLTDSPAIDSKTAEKSPKNRNELVEIKEKMFISQINDIYLNADDYLGKTIKLEGLFKSEQYDGRGKPLCFVLRYAPGCCGNDGSVSIEVAWDAQAQQPYPHEDDWVSAVGTLKPYVEDDFRYLYIALSSLTVLDKRGAEFVTQ